MSLLPTPMLVTNIGPSGHMHFSSTQLQIWEIPSSDLITEQKYSQNSGRHLSDYWFIIKCTNQRQPDASSTRPGVGRGAGSFPAPACSIWKSWESPCSTVLLTTAQSPPSQRSGVLLKATLCQAACTPGLPRDYAELSHQHKLRCCSERQKTPLSLRKCQGFQELYTRTQDKGQTHFIRAHWLNKHRNSCCTVRMHGPHSRQHRW